MVEARLMHQLHAQLALSPLMSAKGIIQRAELAARETAIARARKSGQTLRFDANGQPMLSRSGLQASVFGGEIPLTEMNRRYFGRDLTPQHIEQCIRNAELGYMRDLTDLQYEAMKIDPHFSMVVAKRLRALASIKPQVVPATGDGIDPKRAQQYADVVRQQLAWIPNLRSNITRLNWAHCHGRAALEKVWRENPAGSQVQWRLDSLNWIHPRRLSFGPERELRVVDAGFAGGFCRVGFELRSVAFKFISFTPQQFNDYPEREGFGPRGLYFSFFKRFSWRERLILLEVFGKPWRIVYTDDPAQVQQETLDEAAISADAMGANATGVMPPGVKADVKSPDNAAGMIHKDVIAECNDEISKLVLATTRTADAKPSALGSAGDEIGQEEQSSIFAADGWSLSDVLSEQLAVDIIALNFGPEAIDHAPCIEIPYEVEPSRGIEIDRTVKVFGMGQPLKRSEFYERVGFTEPHPDDDVVQQAAQAAPGVPGVPGVPGGAGFPSGGGGTDSGGGGASPLGNDGADVPNQETFTDTTDTLILTRAARVLQLLERARGQ